MNKARTDLLPILAAAVIVAAGLAAYHNSFSGPFVFDDIHSVLRNPTIRHLRPIWTALRPLHNGATVEGRPLVNLSLAVNYAITGEAVWSYHAFNLAVHLLAGLTLFGLVRRTVARGRSDALFYAFAVALLWTLHPLQTESVTFISDRAESLMGLFYLLTLYCFVRGEGGEVASQPVLAPPSRRRPGTTHSTLWLSFSILFCLLGMATKEVMVSAPLMVLLYDRTFAAGGFREAWRRRRRFYIGLGATWILLGLLLVDMGGNRGNAAGFGTYVPWWMYALTQCRSVVHYLWLAVWPHPLVFDYGVDLVSTLRAVAPQALLLVLLATGTLVALWRKPVLGFLGAWFFVILAPSSSVVPLATQTMAEHRMYLPLAAVIAFVVWAIGKGAKRGEVSTVIPRLRDHCLRPDSFVIIIAALAVGLGCLTSRRNAVYRTQLSLWSDTAQKRPDSARAQYNLGFALDEAGRHAEARDRYERALRLDPFYTDAHSKLADDLANAGRLDEAIAHYQEVLVFDPGNADVRRDLGTALLATGREREALAQFAEADRLSGANQAPASASGTP